MASTARTSSRRPRRRTLLGCLTCRLRKVRCSLEQPECQNCTRLSIQCAGYGGKLKWLNYGCRDGKQVRLKDADGVDGERGAGRREIYSLTERKRMSQHMAQYFDDEQDLEQSLNEALESLENDEPALDVSENVHGVDDIDTLLAGPFGVFQSEVSLLLASHEADTPQPASVEAGSVFDERGQVGLDGVDRVSPGSGHALPPLISDTPTCIAPREILERVLINNGQPRPSSPQSEVWNGPVRPRARDNPQTSHALVDNGVILATFETSESTLLSGEFDVSELNIGSITTQPTDDRQPIDTDIAQDDPTWQGLLIPVDQTTLAEIRMLISHFSSHLADLLSPISPPTCNIHAKTSLDRALLCFSRLNLLGDACIGSCAVLYSLLALSAAHMDSVYQGIGESPDLRIIGQTERNEREWYSVGQRYATLARKSVSYMLAKKQLSKRECKDITIALLNISATKAISDIYEPYPVLLAHCIESMSGLSRSGDTSIAQSESLRCLEYLLLQSCVLDYSLPTPPSSVMPSLDELNTLKESELWGRFLVSGVTTDAPAPEKSIISATEIRKLTGSVIPPLLLQLILDNSLLLRRKQQWTGTQGSEEIASLEKRICDWTAQSEYGDENTLFESIQGEDTEISCTDDDSDSEGGETTTVLASNRRDQASGASLTLAHHTALLLLFFSVTKPTNSLLLKPLKLKLLNQLGTYLREVEEAEAHVGVACGMVWPLKVLDMAGVDKTKTKEADSLWMYVRGGGWKVARYR